VFADGDKDIFYRITQRQSRGKGQETATASKWKKKDELAADTEGKCRQWRPNLIPLKTEDPLNAKGEREIP